jgi:hypothetical protein
MVDTIHDHGSWGVVGCLFGAMDEIKFTVSMMEVGRFRNLSPHLPIVMIPGQSTESFPWIGESIARKCGGRIQSHHQCLREINAPGIYSLLLS